MSQQIAKIEQHIDYIHFICEKCDSVCEVDYLGLDPSIPRLKITCPKCGDLGSFKIEQPGVGFLEWTRETKRDLS